MYNLSIPIINKTVNRENRSDFAELCRAAEIDRIFLAVSLFEDKNALRDNVAYFRSEGFDVAIWVGSTIGHGSTFLTSSSVGGKYDFGRLVNLDGEERLGTYCPFDESFRSFVSESIAALTACGTDTVILDDDFRLSQHGKSPCCFCDLHLARAFELCGESMTREKFGRLALGGKRNKYRDAWLRAQKESLEGLAAAIRKACDKVNPNATLSACSAYCSWDLDGTDPVRITEILAGKNKKLLRLHGAPYWAAHNGQPIVAINEIARMFASFCHGTGIELLAEGDTFPRPRFNTPASLLEIFDGAIRADGGYDGIMKYMLSYNSHPKAETGYIARHIRNRQKREAIDKFFKNGTNSGVRVLVRPHLSNEADLSLSPIRQQSPYPTAGIMLAMCGIPTVYRGDGICSALFGENARHFDVGDFTIIDGIAAAILTERGIDVGLTGVGEWRECSLGSVCDSETGYSSPLSKAVAKLRIGSLSEKARTVLTATSDGAILPLSYVYENGDGKKFLVFTFSADELPDYPSFLRAYEIQSVLQREIERLSGNTLPVKTEHTPELYTMCERDDGYISVALFNCFCDSVLTPEITLDGEWSKIEFSGCSGRLEKNRVILDTDIPAFDFVSFKAYN